MDAGMFSHLPLGGAMKPLLVLSFLGVAFGLLELIRLVTWLWEHVSIVS